MKTAAVRDPFESYLRDIARAPLLTREQEQHYARQLVTHRRRAANLKHRLEHCRSRRVRAELQSMLDQAEAKAHSARTVLIESNLRFVVNRARRYQGCCLSMPDLVAYGNAGLIRAVDKYDPCLGFRLTTYASHWIRQQIERAIQDFGTLVAVPIHQHRLLWTWGKTVGKLERRLRRSPTEKEVAKAMRLDVKHLECMQLAARARLFAAGSPAEMGGDGDTVNMDSLADHRGPGKIAYEDRVFLEARLRRLRRKQREVIVLRFGLGDGQEWTLQAIAERMGLSKERVRQIERQALEVMRGD